MVPSNEGELQNSKEFRCISFNECMMILKINKKSILLSSLIDCVQIKDITYYNLWKSCKNGLFCADAACIFINISIKMMKVIIH